MTIACRDKAVRPLRSRYEPDPDLGTEASVTARTKWQ